jgi:hypothetical protein
MLGWMYYSEKQAFLGRTSTIRFFRHVIFHRAGFSFHFPRDLVEATTLVGTMSLFRYSNACKATKFRIVNRVSHYRKTLEATETEVNILKFILQKNTLKPPKPRNQTLTNPFSKYLIYCLLPIYTLSQVQTALLLRPSHHLLMLNSVGSG